MAFSLRHLLAAAAISLAAPAAVDAGDARTVRVHLPKGATGTTDRIKGHE
ncbi:hypothetical protein [Rubrimonas cliftonensis]|uniref:Uncharacterized protein n=1 Tax=Rubrimonas cliftonensis TaxID=89524 RepID=A0A1H4FS17_9RHOB|nr:hypothetical protein [Rubrimonas cliftonensis]SEA99302.1 hypothetical protein SAMN05444370_12628 [Rubrimonas cliftonensis]